jgi:hypothetical protein
MQRTSPRRPLHLRALVQQSRRNRPGWSLHARWPRQRQRSAGSCSSGPGPAAQRWALQQALVGWAQAARGRVRVVRRGGRHLWQRCWAARAAGGCWARAGAGAGAGAPRAEMQGALWAGMQGAPQGATHAAEARTALRGRRKQQPAPWQQPDRRRLARMRLLWRDRQEGRGQVSSLKTQPNTHVGSQQRGQQHPDHPPARALPAGQPQWPPAAATACATACAALAARGQLQARSSASWRGLATSGVVGAGLPAGVAAPVGCAGWTGAAGCGGRQVLVAGWAARVEAMAAACVPVALATASVCAGRVCTADEGRVSRR